MIQRIHEQGQVAVTLVHVADVAAFLRNVQIVTDEVQHGLALRPVPDVRHAFLACISCQEVRILGKTLLHHQQAVASPLFSVTPRPRGEYSREHWEVERVTTAGDEYGYTGTTTGTSRRRRPGTQGPAPPRDVLGGQGNEK